MKKVALETVNRGWVVVEELLGGGVVLCGYLMRDKKVPGCIRGVSRSLP